MVGANENERAEGAKAGAGDPHGATEAKASPKRRNRSQARPRVELDHPDITGPEFTQRRSFTIQDGIQRFLEENVDTAWKTPDELHIRAANAVWHYGLLKRRPSSVTARRWINQYVAVGERYQLREVKGEGYWILERRG